MADFKTQAREFANAYETSLKALKQLEKHSPSPHLKNTAKKARLSVEFAHKKMIDSQKAVIVLQTDIAKMITKKPKKERTPKCRIIK